MPPQAKRLGRALEALEGPVLSVEAGAQAGARNAEPAEPSLPPQAKRLGRVLEALEVPFLLVEAGPQAGARHPKPC